MTGLAKKLFYLVVDPLTGDSDVGRLKRAVAKEKQRLEIRHLEVELAALRADKGE